MAKSAQHLRQLLDELLSAVRPAAAEISSLGRLSAEIQYIDSGKAREAAVYLTELGYSGAAVRLTEDVGQLRQKADEAFRGPFVAEPTPDERKRERRCLEALHSEAHRFLQFLNGLARLVEAGAGDDDDQDAAHGDDFRCVRWFGQAYEFTPMQAACVKVLWEHWERGAPTVGQETILEAADASSGRLRDVFDKGNHPAWRTMIVDARKGAFRLQPKTIADGNA